MDWRRIGEPRLSGVIRPTPILDLGSPRHAKPARKAPRSSYSFRRGRIRTTGTNSSTTWQTCDSCLVCDSKMPDSCAVPVCLGYLQAAVVATPPANVMPTRPARTVAEMVERHAEIKAGELWVDSVYFGSAFSIVSNWIVGARDVAPREPLLSAFRFRYGGSMTTTPKNLHSVNKITGKVTMKTPVLPVPVVRAYGYIAAWTRDHDVTYAELARAMEIHPSTAKRFAMQLVDVGLVICKSSRTVPVGALGFIPMGSGAPTGIVLRHGEEWKCASSRHHSR